MTLDIAVIGLACRFPGADGADALWRVLNLGRSTLTRFEHGAAPELAADPNYVPVGGVLEDVECFDAPFFGFTAREAAFLDPQHRLFLECVWEALEDAGVSLEACRDIGVFGGASLNSYMIRNLAARPELLSTPQGFLSLVSNEKDYLATRVAYKLNLYGPAVTVQTACSTSLVAVNVAAQSLVLGECSLAVAGGVSVKVPQGLGYLHQEGMPFSVDGACRPFDAAGSGTVFGSGAGVVVLKPLDDAIEDRDDIYAVIRAIAVNNDGGRNVGFTAPSVEGQAEVIRRALAVAEWSAADVGYVEAHGTATPLGDPIEVAALQEGYETPGAGPCRIGSVKSNIGHMETAAGVAGLIKIALMLKRRRLVPSAGYAHPNPLIAFQGSRLEVQTESTPWETTEGVPRRAGLSSFGMGGTNVHMLLEEAPAAAASPAAPARPHSVLTLSARSEAALDARAHALADWIEARDGEDVPALAGYLQTRRTALERRNAVVVTDAADAVAGLRSPARGIRGRADPAASDPVFLYCGGGAQYPAMARGLYRSEPVFRATVERCAAGFEPLIGQDLRDYVNPPDDRVSTLVERMQRPDAMFPALFTVQHAMGEWLAHLGLRPGLVMGHSNGEYAAAVRAGVLSEEAAIALVAARSVLMTRMAPGSMLSVPLPAEALRDVADGHGLSIAAENGPKSTALSGELAPLAAARMEIEATLGVRCRDVHVAAALHSHLTSAIAQDFAAVVAAWAPGFRTPLVRWISTVHGGLVGDDTPLDAAYWVRHLCEPVRFRAAARTLLGAGDVGTCLDLGPGHVAADLLRQNMAGAGPRLVNLGRNAVDRSADTKVAAAALGKLWAAGATIDWSALQGGRSAMKHDLPPYPWQRKRHWIEVSETAAAAAGRDLDLTQATRTDEAAASDDRGTLSTPYAAPQTETEQALLPVWQDFLGVSRIGTADHFIELGGTSLLATSLVDTINRVFDVELELGVFLGAGNVGGVAAEIDRLVAAREERLLADALQQIEGKSTEELRTLLGTPGFTTHG